MQNFKKQYRDLEMSIYAALRSKINDSKQKSKHINQNCIPINLTDYTELVIINDKLTFLDGGGYHYSIHNDVSLEDLIDILNSIK